MNQDVKTELRSIWSSNARERKKEEKQRKKEAFIVPGEGCQRDASTL